MSAERTEEFSEPRVSRNPPVSDDERNSDAARNESAHYETAHSETAPDRASESPVSEVSLTKIGMQNHLPALDDDVDVGAQKEHVVTRDGKADLRFTGVLLASAAPTSAPKGHWQEYRIYQTSGGKHVFSKVTRTIFEGQEDAHEAQIFDPAPSTVPSQLIRSARELAQARPMTWMDAAVAFFGYDPLAKALYRKLSVRFEEQVS
jgi:hypothetical protein